MEHADASLEWTLMGVSVGLAVLSAFVAFHFYVQAPDKPKRLAEKIKGLHSLVYNKYFVDEVYFGVLINPLVRFSKDLWYHIDVNVIDKTTYFVGDLVRGGGALVRSFQNGNIQQYAMYIAIGLVLTLSFILVR